MSAENFNLSEAKIAIVGLGLMGGSLALALKGKCAALFGVDPDPSTRELARRQNIVSLADAGPVNLLPQADVIILAAPVPAILALLKDLPAFMPNPCIVLDLGSSKKDIIEAMATLPAHFDPLGGHPICGKEQLSLVNADAGLYHDAVFILSPLERTSMRARTCALRIVAAIGAHPLWMGAAAHDASIAATSHLPYLLASALTLATPADAAPLIGPGFLSAGRLAATPSSMMLGVLQSNGRNVLSALSRFRHSLDDLETAIIENDMNMLRSLLDQAASRLEELTR